MDKQIRTRKSRTKIAFFLALVVILTSLCQCVTQPCRICEKDGQKKCMWDDEWWDYYERGVSFIEEGCFEEAIADFEKAIEQRERDQWTARIEGVNFIDYFPNREMGIALYYLGEFEKSTIRLETSLKSAPSSKALFYLERAYAALIEESRYHASEQRIPKPQITLNVQRTRNDPVVISGTVTDEKYIKSISVNDKSVFLLNSLKDIKRQEQTQPNKFEILFDKQILLSEGTHPLTVEAENIMGEISRSVQNVAIQVDRSGPAIVITDKQWIDSGSDDKKVVISGFLDDKAGVAKLLINKHEIPARNEKNFRFKEIVSVETDDHIKLEAYDQLQNQTSVILPLSSVSLDHQSPLFACANLTNEFFVPPPDNIPPTIKVRNLRNGQKFSRRDWFTIKVDIEDKSRIESVRVNNKNIPHKYGELISFSYEIDLQKENTIEAVDEKGNKSNVTIMTSKKGNDKGLAFNKFLTQNSQTTTSDVFRHARPMLSDLNMTEKNNFNLMTQKVSNLIAQPTNSSDTILCTMESPQPPFDQNSRLSIFVSPFNITYLQNSEEKRRTSRRFKQNLVSKVEAKHTLHERCRRFNIVNDDDWDAKLFPESLPSIPAVMGKKKELRRIVNTLPRNDRSKCFLFGEERENCFFVFPKNYDETSFAKEVELSIEGEEYGNRLKFIQNLRRKLRRKNIRTNILYERIVSECAEKTYYSLNDSSLEKLKKRKVPRKIIEKLGELKYKEYETTEDFKAVLQERIGNDEFNRYKRMILYYVETDCKHRFISPDNLGKLLEILGKLSKEFAFGIETRAIIYDREELMDLENDIYLINNYREEDNEDLPWELTAETNGSGSPSRWIADELEVEFPYAEGHVKNPGEEMITTDISDNISLKLNSILITYREEEEDKISVIDKAIVVEHPPNKASVSQPHQKDDSVVTQ